MVCLVVGTLNGCFMELKLKVVVVAKDTLIPTDSLLGLLEPIFTDMSWHLATNTSRTADKTLVVLLNLHAVGTGTHIEALGIGLRYNLDQVLVASHILGQQDKVVATLVALAIFVEEATVSYIYLTADNTLEVSLG